MDRTRLTRSEIVEQLGIGRSTWSAYVSRGQAPEAIGYDPQTGERVWDAATVRDWAKNRPGQGFRTDRRKATRDTAERTDGGATPATQ